MTWWCAASPGSRPRPRWARLTSLLAGLGLGPKAAKTRIVHLTVEGEGFNFLGVRHEAPSIRVEVKDRHRCAVAAA
jgi:hypothetical protein